MTGRLTITLDSTDAINRRCTMAKARRSPVNGPGRNKGNLQDWEGPATPATVWFGKTMLQLLRAHAEITQRSFSDIVRDACKNYLATQSGAINHLVEKGE